MALGFGTKKILAQLFITIAEREIEVEKERLELADRASFISFSTFKRIDRYHEGEITPGDIIHFLEQNDRTCSIREAELVIAQYDQNGNG
jgi:Ca2+-binding EF-hand superfamily protein